MAGFTSTVGLIGTGLNAYGQFKSNKDAADASKFNASVAGQNAEAARQSGEFAYQNIQRHKKSAAGTQRALYAKSGVTSAGSPLEVMADTAAEYEIEGLTRKYNAGIQASQYESQKLQDMKKAKNYRTASIVSPLTTIANSPYATSFIERNFFGGKK